MKEEQLRNQINDIIEGEIQLGINEFLEEKQRKESDQGLGFVTSEEAKKLKIKKLHRKTINQLNLLMKFLMKFLEISFQKKTL